MDENVEFFYKKLKEKGFELNKRDKNYRENHSAIFSRIRNAFEKIDFKEHIKDHLKIDPMHQRIILEPYGPIRIKELAKLQTILELEWKISSMSSHSPLKTLRIFGETIDEIDNIFTRSELEDNRFKNMEPVEFRDNEFFIDFLRERIKISVPNGWFGYTEVERYLDGWAISYFIEYTEFLKTFSNNPSIVIINKSKSLEWHENTLKRVIKYLGSCSKEQLSGYDSPPPMFRDRLEQEIDQNILKCPKCNESFTYQLYSLRDIVSEFQCECGEKIPIEYRFGYYRIKGA